MQLIYQQVEELIADVHRIFPSRRPALNARLKHFKRLGFPSGVNTGRGKAAAYDGGATFKLLLAFQLLELGIGPERAVRLIENAEQVIVAAAGYNGRTLYKLSPDHNASLDGPGSIMMYFDPEALWHLKAPDSDADDASRPYELLGWCFKDELSGESLPHRAAIVNVTSLIEMAADHLAGKGVSPNMFGTALLEWAWSFDWTHPDD